MRSRIKIRVLTIDWGFVSDCYCLQFGNWRPIGTITFVPTHDRQRVPARR
jgi:hypothetical protein